MNGIGGIHRRHALKVDIGARELRGDVVDVVGHAAHDGIHDRLGGVATFRIVTMDLLNPLQIDDRHHADTQVDILGYVIIAIYRQAMQTFVEQQIGACFG